MVSFVWMMFAVWGLGGAAGIHYVITGRIMPRLLLRLIELPVTLAIRTVLILRVGRLVRGETREKLVQALTAEDPRLPKDEDRFWRYVRRHTTESDYAALCELPTQKVWQRYGREYEMWLTDEALDGRQLIRIGRERY